MRWRRLWAGCEEDLEEEVLEEDQEVPASGQLYGLMDAFTSKLLMYSRGSYVARLLCEVNEEANEGDDVEEGEEPAAKKARI